MNITLTSLASGSSGNCHLIRFGDCCFLSDCGISEKAILQRLKLLGVSRIQAIFVTHSHTDHIRSVGRLAEQLDVAVYMSYGTAKEVSTVSKERIVCFQPGDPLSLSGVTVKSFPIFHDTASPVAYTFSDGCDKAAVITDTGDIDEGIYHELSGASSIIIEANHDITMLQNGPYPRFLKARIAGPYGHLSNDRCAAVCRRLACDGTSKFLLSHLSEKNNTPTLALSTVRKALEDVGHAYTLKVASRDVPCVL